MVSVVSNSRLRPWNVALLRNQVLQTHALTLESVQPPIYISISLRNVYSFLRSIRCSNQVSKFTAWISPKIWGEYIIGKRLGMSFCECQYYTCMTEHFLAILVRNNRYRDFLLHMNVNRCNNFSVSVILYRDVIPTSVN